MTETAGLNNPMIYVLQAVAEADDAMRVAFTSKAMQTAGCAFSLMQLNNGWLDDNKVQHDGYTGLLEEKRNEYLIASLTPGDDSAIKAKKLMNEYNILNSQSDQDNQTWQGMISSASSGCDELTNSREENISLLGPVMGMQRSGVNLAKQPM